MEKRTAEEMRVLVREVRAKMAEGLSTPEIARALDLSHEYLHNLRSRYGLLPKPVLVKTEGLNWVHPPHIPFLPCR